MGAQIDYNAGRTMCLMISGVNASKHLELASIGVTWAPSVEGGRHWPERKCHDILKALINCDFVGIRKGGYRDLAYITNKGYEFFNIN